MRTSRTTTVSSRANNISRVRRKSIVIMKTAIIALLVLSGIVSVTAWWRDYERLTDESAAKETNWWNYPVRPMPTPSENDLSPSASKPVNYKGGFPLYRAGYGYFRGRRAAQDLEGEEFKWRAYRPVKTSSKGHKKPAEQKSEHKKSGFVPYRAGYGYFSGRR